MHAPSPQQLTWIARSVGLVMLVLAVFSVYLVATCYEPPVDPERFFSLHEGLTKDDVIAALGKPSSIEDDGRRWLYSRFMKVRVVQVLFDEDDIVLARGYTDEEDAGGLASQRGGPEDVELSRRRVAGEQSESSEDIGVTKVMIE
jgi:outer membrane protein assembly factor BamE (lipoprotein component of BamABCDE complex)